MAAERPGLVLLTADTVGGVWTYAVELAGALAAGGTRVALATMGAPLSRAQRAQLAALGGAVTLHESAYRLEWMDAPWEDVERAGGWLLGLERALRPDVVHLNQFAFGALPFSAPTLLVAHSCVCSWWEAVHGEPAPPAWDGYREAVRRGLDGADVVAAPTRAMLAALERAHGARPGAVVLPNGRRAADFPPAGKEPFVLSAGRLWDGAKNLATLAAAASNLPWPVRVAGPTTPPDGVAAAANGVRHVETLGELAPAELAAQLARASIYALPARYEPFGLSALEAALAGCALVLGDIPSLREVWGDAATFVPPDDVEALTGAVIALAVDDARRSRAAASARARALHFTPERMLGGYLRAYELAAARGGPTRDTREASCVS